MKYPPIFQLIDDISEGERLKAEGMKLAADNKEGLLEYARTLAVEIALRKGSVTADDVQFELHRNNISIKALGNAAGSLFVGGGWQWTGEYIKSTRPHAHGNLIRVWRRRMV